MQGEAGGTGIEGMAPLRDAGDLGPWLCYWVTP